MRRATPWDQRQHQHREISIHALLAESDTSIIILDEYQKISIHALLAESDTIFAVRPYDAPIFLSTLSLRRATTQMQAAFKGPEISIHALLAESDLIGYKIAFEVRRISIHALLAESDSLTWWTVQWQRNFYPRSPCGERPVSIKYRHTAIPISIHALLAESDLPTGGQAFEINLFLSTLSLRRATQLGLLRSAAQIYFYPRSPCGERHILPFVWHLLFQFLSTLSLRRATFASLFSIFWICHFYPRSPCGERPCFSPY